MDIDIRKEWFGMAKGCFLSILNSVMALVWRQIFFMLNILWINLLISIKFCIGIDIDKM